MQNTQSDFISRKWKTLRLKLTLVTLQFWY